MADRLRYRLPAHFTTALRWGFALAGVMSVVFGYIGIRAYLLHGTESGISHSVRDVAYYDLELPTP